MFEQETKRFLGLNVGSDPPHGAVFLEFHLQGGHRLALLPGQPLHFLIHFVARGGDGFPLGNPREQQRAFTSRRALSRWLSLTFSQSSLMEFGSTPSAAMAGGSARHGCGSDARQRLREPENRARPRVWSTIRFLGLLLGLVLALRQHGLGMASRSSSTLR